MYCTKCGTPCTDDSVVCEACGTSLFAQEELLNISKYPLDDLVFNEEDLELERHAEEFHNLLNKGIIGLVIGFIVGSVLAGIMNENDVFLPWLIYPLVGGIIFSGVPYGWGLISQVTGGLDVYGNIFIVCFFYILKLLFSLVLGWFIFPVMLLNHYMLSKKPGSKARKICQIIALSILVAPILFVVIVCAIDAIDGPDIPDNDPATSEMATTVSAPESPTIRITAASFTEDDTFIPQLTEIALEFTQNKEYNDVNNYGWTVTEPTQIHYILFFDPEETYHNSLCRPDLTNAIMIISGYHIANAGGVSIDAWEMDMQVFPNISYADASLIYESDNAYQDEIRKKNVSDILEYVYERYGESDMTVLYEAQP